MSTAETNISGKASSTHYHDDRYYTESEIDVKLSNVSNAVRLIGIYQQEITLAGDGEFFQAIPSNYQNGGYFYIINCSNNSLNFTANMEGYYMAVKNRSSNTLSTVVQVYCLSKGI